MPYPIIKDADARIWWKQWSENAEAEVLPELPDPDIAPDGADLNWSSIVPEMVGTLETLYDAVDGDASSSLTNDRFEARACVLIHKSLPTDDALADPEFWIWMSTGPGLSLIRRRYARSGGDGRIPDRLNFSSASGRETFYYRLWLRAELAFDERRVDPYELAEYGDVDFWRSHVFRQMSAESDALLSAFINFQHPYGPNGEKRLSQEEIRKLVKYIRRAAANIVVEALDEESATQFVEEQWQKIRATTSSKEPAE